MANPIQVDVNALPNIPVQIEIRSDGKVVWVHVNGYTVVRINDVSAVEIIDNRKEAL